MSDLDAAKAAVLAAIADFEHVPADEIRDRVAYLNLRATTVNVALFSLLDEGWINVDSRWFVSKAPVANAAR